MRSVRILLAATAAGAAFVFAVPANAAVVVGSGDAGTEYAIDFVGQIGGHTEAGVSSLLTLTFTGTSNGGTTYNFDYGLLNDSDLASRLRSFGFDVVGSSLSSASATGAYGNVKYGNNFPEGVGTLDVCFRADGGNVCTGGPNGLLSGESASGTLSLTFGSALGSLTLDNFTTRYQSISGSNYGDSGVGLGTHIPAVPEPTTWALMLLGLGAAGWAMRRKPADQNPRMRVLYN